jgi:hypothetical protein
MGDLIEAQCKCGFMQKLMFGGGMSNFQTFCGVPAYCKSCKKMFNLNYFVKDSKCPDCHKPVVFYNSKSLQGPPTGNKKSEPFAWNLDDETFELPAVFYLCPKCQKFLLNFRSVGNFD